MGALANEISLGVATAFLQLKDQGFFEEINKAQSAMNELGDTGASISDKLSGIATGMVSWGDSMTRNVTLPILNGTKDVINTYRDMESAFTGVRKTIDETRFKEAFGDAVDGWEVLDEAIKEISQSTASTYEEVAKVMEWAGQLNIPLGKNGETIKEFTRVMVELGDSTDLASDEAAEFLAKFMNIMGTSPADIRNLGSAIVDLGNNSATTERDIVEMSMRLAGAGAQAGLTEQDILAIATTLTSLGIRAEMGGSAFSKAIVKMQVAVKTGFDQVNKLEEATGMTLRDIELMSTNNTSAFKELAQSLGMTTTEIKDVIKAGNNLNDFANIANMTTEEFVKLYEEDATAALAAFIDGLGNTENSGESAIEMLDEMGFREVRLRDTLLRVSNAQGLLNDSLERANNAWGENSALEEEANKRYETLDAQINQLNERWKEMKYDIADMLLPVLERLMDILDDLIEKWGDLSDEDKQAIIDAIAIAAVVGPIVSILGRLLGAISNIIKFVGILRSWDILTKLGKIKGVLAGLNATPLGTLVSGIVGFLKTDVSAIAATGAAGAGTIFAASFLAAVGGYAFGNKLGAILFPDDAELYEKYSGFEGFFQLCKDTATTAAEEIKYSWDDLQEDFNTWMNSDFSTTSGNFFLNLAESAGKAFPAIGVMIDQFKWDVENAEDTGTEAFGNIGEAALTSADDVESGLSASIESAAQWVVDMENTAGEAGSKFHEKLQDNLVEAAEGVVQFEEDVTGYAKETGEKFVENFKTIEELPAVAELVWQDIDSSVKQFKEDFSGAAKLAGEDFHNNIIEPLTELPGKVKEKWDDMIEDAKSFAKDMADKGLEAAKDFKDNLVETASEIPDKMKEIGKSIVDGIWQGIKGAKDKFSSDVKGFFNGIVKGAKKDLDINSPSGVFADEVGRWIPLGILQGIEETMPLTIDTMNDIINDGIDELNPDVELNTSVDDFVETFKDGFSTLLTWFQNIEEKFINSINNMANSVLTLNDLANNVVSQDSKVYVNTSMNPINPNQEVMEFISEKFVELFNNLSDVYSNDSENIRDITIPVYIGSELIDNIIVTSTQRVNYLTGGL